MPGSEVGELCPACQSGSIWSVASGDIQCDACGITWADDDEELYASGYEDGDWTYDCDREEAILTDPGDISDEVVGYGRYRR